MRSSSPFVESGVDDGGRKSQYFERARDSVGADALHERISDLKVREVSPFEEKWAVHSPPRMGSPRSSANLIY